MRVVSVDACSHPPAARRSPVLPRALLACLLYTTPFVLLCLRLWHEMQAGVLPLDGSAVLIRFVVVGGFSVLLSRWVLQLYDSRR
jgi:hypothetical protein